MSEVRQEPLADEAGNFYNDWTIVFKSGAILELKQVALVRHLTGNTLEKIVVTRSVPLGAEVAVNDQGEFELPLDEISGAFRATPPSAP